ncbi:hypothetical protein C8J57DRAFT_161971 [Mycena rebaudengoi]|nr:hypothetical protein C8J57DRAFT_161971 [Mycena rebaudengoi]
MLDPVAFSIAAYYVYDALSRRRRARRRASEPNLRQDMVTVTPHTVPNGNPTGGHARIGGNSQGGDAHVNAAPHSNGFGMEGYARTGGSGGNEGPPTQIYFINSVVNLTTSGGIGGPGGSGLSVGGRGGDGGGASMLDAPPRSMRHSFHSTGDAALRTGLFTGGDGTTAEGSVIDVHAVQTHITRRSIDIHSTPAHLARTVDEAALETVGEHDGPREAPVVGIQPHQRSMRIRSTPPPLPPRPARIVDC